MNKKWYFRVGELTYYRQYRFISLATKDSEVFAFFFRVLDSFKRIPHFYRIKREEEILRCCWKSCRFDVSRMSNANYLQNIYICTWRSSIFRNISITLKIIHHKEAPFKRKNYLLWKVCYFLLTSRVVKFIIICYSRVAFARRGTVFGEPLTTGIYAQTWNPPRSWYTPGTSSCRDHLLQLRRYLTDLIYCLTDNLNETILPRELQNKPRVINANKLLSVVSTRLVFTLKNDNLVWSFAIDQKCIKR